MLHLFPAVSQAADVIQTPDFHVARSMENISMTCEHDNSGYSTKLWYRQVKGMELVLIGYTVNTATATMENGFDDGRISIRPEKIEKSIMTISKLSSQDSAVYYCASSTQ